MANHPLTDFLARLVRRENLNRDEAFELLEALLDPEATDAQISGAFVALASKGETVEELTGLAEGLRSRAVRLCRNTIASLIPPEPDRVVRRLSIFRPPRRL